MTLHKQIPPLFYITVTPTNNIWF